MLNLVGGITIPHDELSILRSRHQTSAYAQAGRQTDVLAKVLTHCKKRIHNNYYVRKFLQLAAF